MQLRKTGILLVDNELDFLTMLENLLLTKLANISITKAISPEEASKKVESRCFDIVVIDKRLTLDTDANDESGISLAKDIAEKNPGIKIIMLTGFADHKDITRKLPSFDEYGEPVLSGYISKDDSPEEWCSAIYNVIKNDLYLDFDSKINLIGFPFKELKGLLVGVRFGNKIIESKDTDLLKNLSIQLVDLFGKIYSENGEITLMPLKWGYRGTEVVGVYRDQNLLEIFKFGDRERIEREYRNYKDHVAGKISERTIIEDGKFARTKDLGGIAYTFIGADLNKIEDFGKYFKENDPDQIKEFLTNFFSENLGLWYKNVQSKKPHDPKETYIKYLNLNASRLEEKIRKYLPVSYHDKEVDIQDFDLSFENPYIALTNANFKPFTIQICRIHGDLNPRNILVDKNRGWLIDFFSTGLGHALRDLIKLETSVKFELITVKNLYALINFEKALLEPDSFKAEYVFRNYEKDPDLEKSFECIKHIRWLAYDLIRPKNIWEYYIGLFFTTLKHLEFDDVPGLSRKFAFISAGLIYEKLKKQGLVIKTPVDAG